MVLTNVTDKKIIIKGVSGMGHTIIEKIIRNNIGKDVKAGEIVTVNVDRVMIHDIFIPFVASKFEEMGFKKLWDADKVVLIYDHLVPASQVDDTRHFKIGNEFVKKYGMKNIHRADGICHQLMTEAGYVKPGNIVFGTDSHTTTYGCVGAFSSGIGYTEMASILGTGTMWVKVPETIKVNITGKLPENVMAKDIILRLIGDLGADGATYKALEFSGDTVDNMSVASRMSMSNMLSKQEQNVHYLHRMKRLHSIVRLLLLIRKRILSVMMMRYIAGQLIIRQRILFRLWHVLLM